MCLNECMPFKKFYHQDLNSDHEVSFILELTSILQNEFHKNILLNIKSERSLDQLIEQFIWTSKPVIVQREINTDECWIDLSHNSKIETTGYVIVSSESDLTGSKVHKIPAHLLNSKIKYPELITSMAWSVARAIANEDFYKSDPDKIITIVSTNEVNEWISLIEAASSIIAYWYRYQDSTTKVELLDLSQGIQKAQANKVALASDCLVIVKISPTTSQFIKLTRMINPDCKMIFHGFESASVYFANTSLYGIDEYLYQQDLWIMSCEADAELAKLSWKNIKTEVVPLKTLDLHKASEKKTNTCKHIYYFGRISEQKNLNASLFAVSLVADEMRKHGRKFKIFGYEDYLGVPNLRIPSSGYLEDLWATVKQLQIRDLVEFHPAVPVDKMEEELAQGIFLSPSIHSDENFGLVAFRALKMGTPAILSKWGGHIDLSSSFKNIEYVDVFETSSGPEVNPCQIAKILLKVWNKNPVIEEIKRQFKKLPLEWNGKDKLLMSDLKLEVVKRVSDVHPWTLRKWPLYGKIFKNNHDPKYLMAQRIYGAGKLPVRKKQEQLISPLVSMNSREIKIKDPRLGVLRHPRQGNAEIELNQLGTNKKYHLSLPESNWLWENGYIYLRESL